MQTLEDWLVGYEVDLGGSADWEFSEHVVREAFPKALKIIRAILQTSKEPGLSLGLRLKDAAEAIINEK